MYWQRILAVHTWHGGPGSRGLATAQRSPAPSFRVAASAAGAETTAIRGHWLPRTCLAAKDYGLSALSGGKQETQLVEEEADSGVQAGHGLSLCT